MPPLLAWCVATVYERNQIHQRTPFRTRQHMTVFLFHLCGHWDMTQVGMTDEIQRCFGLAFGGIKLHSPSASLLHFYLSSSPESTKKHNYCRRGRNLEWFQALSLWPHVEMWSTNSIKHNDTYLACRDSLMADLCSDNELGNCNRTYDYLGYKSNAGQENNARRRRDRNKDLHV